MSQFRKFSNRAIKNTVGRKAVNMRADVALVQTLLNDRRNQPPVPFQTRLEVDGVCGPITVRAIGTFQAQVMRWGAAACDGRVDPGGKTWTRLNGNVETSRHVRPINYTPLVQLSSPSRPPAPISVARAPGLRTDGVTAPVAPSVVPFEPAGSDTAATYTKFSQLDYGSSVLGNRYGGDADKDGIQDKMTSISSAGCALTSLTMAATRIGTPNKHWPKDLQPKDLTPISANEIVRKGGGFNSTYLLIMDTAAQALGMVPDQFGFGTVALPSNAAEKIKAHLMKDLPVAAHVDYKRDDGGKGDHWVLLTNVQGDGKIRAIDPSGGGFMTFTSSSTNSARYKITKEGCLFGEAGTGFGPKTTANQPNYCVVRYILLSEVAGTPAAQ